MYVDGRLDSNCENSAFQDEQLRLNPLIVETKKFTGGLAFAASAIAKNIISQTERNRAWKTAGGKIRVFKIQDCMLGQEAKKGIMIHNLSVHQNFSRRLPWPSLLTESINVRASLKLGTHFKGMLDTTGRAHTNKVDAPWTEDGAYNYPGDPTEQLTRHHVGMLASGICIANALNLLAENLSSSKLKPIKIPDTSNLLDGWSQDGVSDIVSNLLDPKVTARPLEPTIYHKPAPPMTVVRRPTSDQS